jgi:hypothetical protein
MRFIYLYMLSFLSFGYTFSQSQNDIKLIATELHSEYFYQKKYKKENLKSYVKTDSLFLQFPDSILSFEFAPKKKDKNFILECELRTRRIKKKIKKHPDASEVVPELLSTTFKGCYAKYIQSSPEIRFAFELQNNHVTYHINEVSVYIYYTKVPLSSDKNFFKHKADEREKLFLDIAQLNKTQSVKLSQTYPVKDGGLALNLRLLPSQYWQGSFEKTRVLLKISFKFSNGQIIHSEPFMVDM